MILDWGIPSAAAILAAVGCRLVAIISLRRADDSVMRTNVDGDRVPVVLGWPVVAGALTALLFIAIWSEQTSASSAVKFGYRFFPQFREGFEWIPHAFTVSIAFLMVGMYRAGLWDDLQGDERPRGFGGHLEALRGGRVTGGLVKLLVGGAVGIVVAWITLDGYRPLLLFLPLAAAMPLGANALNLLDRAPGRAGKVFLLVGVPLAVFGDPLWRTLAAGAIGAVAACLPLDLKAKGMLGDAGANPLGALLGFGLAVNLAGATWALVGFVVVLLALNLASEKWSFSEVIAKNRVLARLDHLGRK